MQLQWREEMATGVEAIDEQHKELLHKIEALLKACRDRRAEEEIARLIWYLKRYVRKHFHDEEALQIQSEYPAFALHKAQHFYFYTEVKRLEGRFAREGANSALVVQATQMMCKWLRNHFLRADQLLADYLQQRCVEQQPQ